MIAELDTAAIVSCIFKKIVEEFEISCNEIKGFNIMADANVKIPRTKEPIEIILQADKAEISIKFKVISNLNNAQKFKVNVDKKKDLIQNVQKPIIKKKGLDLEPCNVPEAMVYLNTSTNSGVYKRQYLIAKRWIPLIDKEKLNVKQME
ncbi:hypothetical protein BB561_002976 [Smittium simulii]|uniref:Uncharacterized protein n=1 Tax=Smittium simulii TaxID=133385 RepID=A0A2T9YNG4_9FUNG|nr:hypothetical protein BB561_002976 [Smittium simulii]